MKYLNDADGRYKLALKGDAGNTVATLLRGDPLHEIERSGDRVKVRARRRTGWVPTSAVGDTGLLEAYVIDVGQGDGMLMRTPHDDAWQLVDAGVRAADQMTRKGATNFVRWKFIDDLQRDRVSLRNAIVTHPDADPFGGMIDLLSGALPTGAASRSRSNASGTTASGASRTVPGWAPCAPIRASRRRRSPASG